MCEKSLEMSWSQVEKVSATDELMKLCLDMLKKESLKSNGRNSDISQCFQLLTILLKFHTKLKFHDFFITQILREINFEDSKSAKSAVFAILGDVHFVHLVNVSLQKVQKSIESKFKASKCVKMSDFALHESQKLISL